LWIGTDGAGLFRLKDDDCLQLGSTNGLAGDQVRGIYEGKDHSLWIGTTAGLSHYRDGVFKTYTTRNGLLSDMVSDVLEDRDGNLWIGTGSGLNRLRSNGAIDSFAMPNGLPNDSVRGICQDRGGRIWIGSNNGLLWYNWFWGRSFYAYNSRYGLSDSFVSAIREDLEGNMWVGTYSGLNRFHEGRFINVADNEGLPFGHIYCLLEDTDSDLWVGSRDGLVRLTPKRFTTYTRQHGLTHNNVTSVMQDREGTMWIGTWGGGLDSLKDDKITSLKGTNRTAQNLVVSPPISPSKIPAASSPNGVAEDLVLSLCEGRDGCLWVGADFNGGLTRIKDGSVRHYTAKDGLINAGLRVLHEDRAGNLWIGTSQGLGRFTDGKFTTLLRTNGLPSDSIHAICEDQSGNVWFGTEAGLSQWTKGSFVNLTTKDGLSTNTILSLYADEQNALWIGTRGGGLNRYKDGRFSACTAQQGLFSDEIFTILEDDNRWLWMSCSRGVFRILKRSFDDLAEGKVKTITSITYDRNDGMETAQCNDLGQPAGWKSHDGTLWFATGKGLAKVDPRTVKIDRVPPPVFITDLIADRRRVEWKSEPGNSQPFNHSQKPRELSAPLRVPPGRGELEFHFTALNLSALEKSRFRYKLEGIDDDWTEAGAHRVAAYKNVPPGPYRFSVSACNKDGVWNEAGASLSIIYLPHLSQTWWFRALAVLAIVGAAGGAARFITRRRMERQLAFLEQRNAVERERGRIAKDIHDDLGSSLTRIMMLGERAEEGLTRCEDVGGHLHKIVGSARSTIRALDEIVWAINPENDTLDGLVVYIGHYADELFEDTSVHCRLEIPMELPPLSLPAETRHNLFLVAKEAFHNVLKHSHGSEVRVRVAATNATIQMEIEDNGRGLPEPADSKGRKGNGLENMRKRMKNIGGEFELTSAPKKGVKLMFRIQFSEVSKR
jgi:ligand-binding sensor domain-containing protein/signal transduction histidine kinase